jgi:hypothetical protein
MYQVTVELTKFITFEFSKEDIKRVRDANNFDWDVNNMLTENFEEYINNSESFDLENSVEEADAQCSVSTIVPIK